MASIAARVGVLHTLPWAGPEVIRTLRPLLTRAFSTTSPVNTSVPMCATSSVPIGHQSCVARSLPTHVVDTLDSRVRWRSYAPRDEFVAESGPVGPVGCGHASAGVASRPHVVKDPFSYSHGSCSAKQPLWLNLNQNPSPLQPLREIEGAFFMFSRFELLLPGTFGRLQRPASLR